MGRLGVAVLCGLVGACFYLTVLSGSPGSIVFVALAQLPLFVAGLWLGAGAAAVAGTTAAGLLLAGTGVLSAACFAALYAAPVALLVRQALLARRDGEGALEWYPPGLLTAWLAALALAGTVLGVLALGGRPGIEQLLRQALAPEFSRLWGESSENAGAAAAGFALFFPGMTAASWIMLTVICGALAQGLLARFGANWRPTPDLAGLVLPGWISILFGAAAAAALIGGEGRFFGVNAMLVLAVPLCLGGLAVLHTGARRFAQPMLPLIVFYVAAGLFGWPLLLLALLGLLEAPLGLRRRLAPPPSFGG